MLMPTLAESQTTNSQTMAVDMKRPKPTARREDFSYLTHYDSRVLCQNVSASQSILLEILTTVDVNRQTFSRACKTCRCFLYEQSYWTSLRSMGKGEHQKSCSSLEANRTYIALRKYKPKKEKCLNFNPVCIQQLIFQVSSMNVKETWKTFIKKKPANLDSFT